MLANYYFFLSEHIVCARNEMSKRFVVKSLSLVNEEPVDKTLTCQIVEEEIFSKKSSIDEFRESLRNRDILQKKIECIKKLHLEHTSKVPKLIREKVLKRALAKQPICNSLNQNKKHNKNEDKTVFTEEDFARFEKEYHP